MGITRRGTLALPALMALPSVARAAETVRIGCILPLTGNSAAQGLSLKHAIELAVKIINDPTPELKPALLAADTGLPRLGGAKIKAIYSDDQGSPSVAQSAALRLITQDHVTALVGSYASSATLTSSAVAERYGVPFVNGASSAANLTERGYRWFFRVTPIEPDYVKLFFDFLADVAKTGMATSKIAIVYENTDFGTSFADAMRAEAQTRGTHLTESIAYSASGADVSPQVLKLKAAAPDVAIFASYTSDAILYAKTFQTLDYRPPIMIADSAGFYDPSFIEDVGSIAQGVLSRSGFAAGRPGSITYKLNEMFKQAAGRNLDPISARTMQAFFVLCDAINRAGSTTPNAIREALVKTDIPQAELIVYYRGVKFNSKGQNTLGSAMMVQLQGTGYVPVWPAPVAVAKLQLPFRGWT